MNRPAPIIAGTVAAVLLLFVVFGAYMSVYLLRSTREELWPKTIGRGFVYEWEATLFTPAAKVEGLCTGEQVIALPEVTWDRIDRGVYQAYE